MITATTYTTTNYSTAPASFKQISYLSALVAKRDPQNLEVIMVASLINRGGLSMPYASKCIAAMLALPEYTAPASVPQPGLITGSYGSADSPLEFGIYDSMPFKPHDHFISGRYVLLGKTAQGVMRAKRLYKSYSTVSGFTWQKTSLWSTKKAISDGLYTKLDTTTVASLGKKFNMCMFCGAVLFDEPLVDAGYGPVCAKKFGLDWGKK